MLLVGKFSLLTSAFLFLFFFHTWKFLFIYFYSDLSEMELPSTEGMQARSGFDDCVGNTPLILLSGLSRATSCLIYGSTPPPKAPRRERQAHAAW
jgi:hypothetical protein